MYTALIVDDDRWALADAKQCFPFREFKFHLLGACMDAEHAMRLIRIHKPDLVITDIRMGNMSGLDLLRECHEEDIQSLFVILSGYDLFPYAQEAIFYNAFRYMLKPIRDSEAREAIQSAAAELRRRNKSFRAAAERSDDAFNNVLAYIEHNYHANITLETLSEEFFINRTYICDLFRKRKNTTFSKYLQERRMAHARHLLERSDMPISAVGRTVGYADAYYFMRVFKRAVGMTPHEYRNQHINTCGGT